MSFFGKSGNFKQIYFMRHAKSSWDNANLDDFERPLNKRGTKDAQLVTQEIKKIRLIPDKILCSAAVRTRSTLDILKENLEYPNEIEILNELYLVWEDDLLEIIKNQNNDIEKLMIIGHNPTMEKLSSMYTKTLFFEMPTSCFVAVQLDIKNWKKIDSANGSLIKLIIAKDLRNS